MLIAVNNISPRGVYVCGSHSTTTGLTVKLMKEAGSGDYSLEAGTVHLVICYYSVLNAITGALVLGDRGCCCIDEFDKMPAEHQALLEAMEQQVCFSFFSLQSNPFQSVSIAKAGIVCNLPARTSVIAAANPSGGHYEYVTLLFSSKQTLNLITPSRSKTVSENLKMGPALLSRFDVIFILLDKPDEERDKLLSEHVISVFQYAHSLSLPH
jgi:DNA helicase MCM8